MLEIKSKKLICVYLYVYFYSFYDNADAQERASAEGEMRRNEER